MRDICRAARANVAAVNYHFGDKGGLYREVLQLAIDTIRATSDAARAAGDGKPAEERLRRYIQVSLSRVTESHSTSWIARLINREMADPTPAFDTLVEQGVRPRIDDLSAIVAEMLGCPVADERVPGASPASTRSGSCSCRIRCRRGSGRSFSCERQHRPRRRAHRQISRSPGSARWRAAPARMEAERLYCR